MITGGKADEVRKTFGLLAGTSENAQDVLKNHTVSHASSCSCRCQDLSTEVEGMNLDMVISETRAERESAYNTKSTNTLRNDLAYLRKEMDELKGQVMSRPFIDYSTQMSQTEDDNISLKRENVHLNDYLTSWNRK